MLLGDKQFCKLAAEGKLLIKLPMTKLHNAFGIISFKCERDKKKLIECIVEDYHKIFKIEEAFKVTLRAKDKQYGSEDFYVSDLTGLINSGYIKCSIISL